MIKKRHTYICILCNVQLIPLAATICTINATSFLKNTFVSNIDKLNSKTVIKISKLIFTYLEHKLIDPTVNIWISIKWKVQNVIIFITGSDRFFRTIWFRYEKTILQTFTLIRDVLYSRSGSFCWFVLIQILKFGNS